MHGVQFLLRDTAKLLLKVISRGGKNLTLLQLKELLAIFYGFRSFLSMFTGNHVLIRTDNTVALAYVKNFGGINCPIMDFYARKLWNLAYQNNIWLSVNYIPGKINDHADRASRKLTQYLEWSIPPLFFNTFILPFGPFTIDLFASRLNNKLNRYASMIPDPYAMDIDAFSFQWTLETPYLFPPFNMIFRCLQKIQLDQVQKALLIFPLWTTQHWMPRLLTLMMSPVFILPHHLLYLPWPSTILHHPLEPRLQLAMCLVTANKTCHQTFLQTLNTSSIMEFDRRHSEIMRSSVKSGQTLCFQGSKSRFTKFDRHFTVSSVSKHYSRC